MLVLTRKVGERIRLKLGDGTVIWVVIVDIDRGKCRVGVEAPKEIAIFREELLEGVPHGDDNG
jgi:carbon storage regulator